MWPTQAAAVFRGDMWGVGGGGMGDFEEEVRAPPGRDPRSGCCARRGERPSRTARHPGPGRAAAAVRGGVRVGAGHLPATRFASAVARIGVLSSVDAAALGDVLGGALEHARSAHSSADPSRYDIQREISLSLREILASADGEADGPARVRSDIAMVLREIDAGGTVLRAAIESGNEELQREVLAAVEAVSAEFGELAFPRATWPARPGRSRTASAGRGTRAPDQQRAGRTAVGRRAADPRGTGGHRTPHHRGLAARGRLATRPRAGSAGAPTAGCSCMTGRKRRCSSMAGNAWTAVSSPDCWPRPGWSW